MLIGINQKVAPIRLCFFIYPDSDKSFLKAIEIAFGTWAGMLSPIIPFYEDLPDIYKEEFQIHLPTSEYYNNIISNFDPDIIVYENGIDKALIEKHANGRAYMTFQEFSQRSSQMRHHYGITLEEIATHIADDEFKFVRADGMKILFPKIPDSEVFLKAYCGCLSNDVLQEIDAIFENLDCFNVESLGWDKLDDLYNSNIIDLRTFNCYKIRLWRNNKFWNKRIIYFFNSKRLQDVINFWNLRAAGVPVIPIPIDAPLESYIFFEKKFKECYEDLIADSKDNQPVMIHCLMGYDCDAAIIDDLHKRVFPKGFSQKNVQYAIDNKFPRYWENLKVSRSDDMKSHTPFLDTHFEHYSITDDSVELSVMALPFVLNDDLNRLSSYKVILSINLHDDHVEYAGLIDGISNQQAKQLMDMLFIGDWRLSNSQFHVYVHPKDSRFRFRLVRSGEYFQSFYNNYGFKAVETANSKLAKEVLKNIGGIFGASLFLRNGPLKVIELFEGGKVVSYSQLLAELKKTLGNKANHNYFIARLIENKIIEFGAQLKCSICDQRGFYLIPQIIENITCTSCRNQFSLPMSTPGEIMWAYRGIGPFTKSNKADGVLAVFATLKFFMTEISNGNGRMTAEIGIELEKKGKAAGIKLEIDLSIILGDRFDELQKPDLLFCECKTYKYFTEIDIVRLKTLGDEFPGAILVLATLNSELTSKEKELLKPFIEHFQQGDSDRPVNSVLILTGKELLPEQYGQAFKAYKDQIRHFYGNDFLVSLCDLSVRKHLDIPSWAQITHNRLVSETSTRHNMINAIVHAIANSKGMEIIYSQT